MGPRCASLPRRTKLFRRTIERGQKSSRCYAKRYEKPWKRAGRASAPLAFSLPASPPRSPPLFRFSAISGWASREFSHFSAFQHRNLVASSPTRLAFTFCLMWRTLICVSRYNLRKRRINTFNWTHMLSLDNKTRTLKTANEDLEESLAKDELNLSIRNR